MQILLVVIKSKSIKSINYCTHFLIFCFKKVIKNYVKKQRLQKLNKTRINLLKSPHIYKSAQEQFEQRFYKQKILFTLPNLTKFKFVLLIKKLLNFSFYDISFAATYFLLKFSLKNMLKFLHLDNFYLNLNKNYSNKFFDNHKYYYYYSRKLKTYSFFKLLNLTGVFFYKAFIKIV